MNDAFFEVEEREVFIPTSMGKRKRYKSVERYKSIVRADDDEPLSIVSKNYNLIPHKKVVEIARAAIREYKFKEYIRVAQDGAQMFARFVLVNSGNEIRSGDVINPVLEVSNCYDMTFRLGFELCAERLVCSNGMRLPVALSKMARKHIGAAADVFLRELNQAMDKWEPAFRVWRKWSETTIVTAKGYEVIEKIDTLPRKFRRKVIDRWVAEEENKTVYDLYNHLTYVTTHELDTTVDRQRELETLSNRQFEMAIKSLGVVA